MASNKTVQSTVWPSQQNLRHVFGAGSAEYDTLSSPRLTAHRKAANRSVASTLATTFGLLAAPFKDKNKSRSQKRKQSAATESDTGPRKSLTLSRRASESVSLNGMSDFIYKSSSSVSDSFRSLSRRASQISLFGDSIPVSDEEEEQAYNAFVQDVDLSPVHLVGFDPSAKQVLTDELADEIRTILPERIKLFDTWQLVYNLEQHGASLGTLYKNCEPPWEPTPSAHGYVIVVKDNHGAVFGAYVNEHFRIQETRRFYGNGDCFLWKFNAQKQDTDLLDDELHGTTSQGGGASSPLSPSLLERNESISKAPRFQAFMYTGLNHYSIFSQRDYLAVGSSDGHYGLWLDANLENGLSQRTDTFGNEPLSEHGASFQILAVEVWRIGR